MLKTNFTNFLILITIFICRGPEAGYSNRTLSPEDATEEYEEEEEDDDDDEEEDTWSSPEGIPGEAVREQYMFMGNLYTLTRLRSDGSATTQQTSQVSKIKIYYLIIFF